jgi:hypothetical protein
MFGCRSPSRCTATSIRELDGNSNKRSYRVGRLSKTLKVYWGDYRAEATGCRAYGQIYRRWGQKHTDANTVIGIEKQGSSDILTELSLIGTRHRPFGQNPSATVNVRRVLKHSLNGR